LRCWNQRIDVSDLVDDAVVMVVLTSIIRGPAFQFGFNCLKTRKKTPTVGLA
jgi:hypothetical protein